MKPNTLEMQRTRYSPQAGRLQGTNELNPSARSRSGATAGAPPNRILLLISDDAPFHERLRCFANAVGRIIVRADRAAGAVTILQAVQPLAVLLDLDSPKEAAWETAEALLREPSCPPLILLTAGGERFELTTAVSTNSLVPKSESPSGLLKIVDETLAMRNVHEAEGNATQRILIRRLRQDHRSARATPKYRFWGINE